ncbi:ATP phosphoribosyltransferase regulatory subunit, partial [Gryllotalpicola sp.]|uniref:histidine--tRNA ligase n=1 Tax=Gryllotalpicola sp. TaxID=1932787 RepID=UPI002621E299
MASDVTPPRGMRDFLPLEKAKREAVLGIIRAGYIARGFEEIETPVVEDAARLHSGLGGDNEKLAFGILRRGLEQSDLDAAAAAGSAEGLADLGLRFDLTVPLARYYATNRAKLPGVFKALQIAPVWRAERPQKGRYRQFVQCDIDIIGEPSALAEVELIAATAATLTELGIAGARIRINHRRILRTMLASWGIADDGVDRALVIVDKEDKIGVSGVVAELVDLGLLPFADADRAAADLGGLPDDGWGLDAASAPAWLDLDAYREIHAIRDAVAAAAPGVPLVFSHNLVRGMGYYTGAIFEIQHPEFGYSLGGGGRYDGMIGRFLGEEVPAAGFSIGFERIVDLVPASAAHPASLVLLHDAAADPGALVKLQGALLAEGRRVRLEKRAKNLRPQLERLAVAGYST